MPDRKLTKEFTKNEVISTMHKNTAWSLRKISDHVIKYGLTVDETTSLLQELADELDAQSMVVELRDKL
jgi:hypothetical protein